MSRNRTTAGIVATAVAATALLSACSFSASAGTSPDFEGDKLAGSVQKALTDANPGVTVTGTSCQDTPVVDAGLKTDCTATVNGETTKLVVSWKDDDGNYAVDSVPQ